MLASAFMQHGTQPGYPHISTQQASYSRYSYTAHPQLTQQVRSASVIPATVPYGSPGLIISGSSSMQVPKAAVQHVRSAVTAPPLVLHGVQNESRPASLNIPAESASIEEWAAFGRLVAAQMRQNSISPNNVPKQPVWQEEYCMSGLWKASEDDSTLTLLQTGSAFALGAPVYQTGRHRFRFVILSSHYQNRGSMVVGIASKETGEAWGWSPHYQDDARYAPDFRQEPIFKAPLWNSFQEQHIPKPVQNLQVEVQVDMDERCFGMSVDGGHMERMPVKLRGAVQPWVWCTGAKGDAVKLEVSDKPWIPWVTEEN